MWPDNGTVEDLLPLAGSDQALRPLIEGINTNLVRERQIARARRLILDAYAAGHAQLPALRPLCIALAHQAFNNEYVVAVAPEEMARVPAPEAPSNAPQPAALAAFEWTLIVAAMYRPPTGLDGILIERLSDDVRMLIRRTLLQPAQERAIAAGIPSVGLSGNETSVLVRGLYERHPYPRWFHVAPSGKTIRDELSEVCPAAQVTVIQPSRILVAGCGTGHHAIRVALDNPDAEVVGLDFSKAALAYGVRMAGELGVRNITFLHGDLLSADRMCRSFGHIECMGVLHHIREHERAWMMLRDLLEPGGTLKVGVYSRVARLHVEAVRQAFPLSGDADSGAIVALRSRLLEDPSWAAVVSQLARHRDFFATSTIRDLVFHVFERTSTVSDIRSIVSACGLELLGVSVPLGVRSAVESRQPGTEWPITDFERWQAVEWAYAGTGSMFRFWLRKPAGDRIA